MKLWRLPEIEGFILKCRVLRLWLTYVSERMTTFATAYGIKLRCYREHVGEHIGNQGKMKKNPLPGGPPPPPNLKGKNARHLEGMLGPSHSLHEISVPKRVHHHFWPQLIPLAKNTCSTGGTYISVSY
jgi:hypothetical protein